MYKKYIYSSFYFLGFFSGFFFLEEKRVLNFCSKKEEELWSFVWGFEPTRFGFSSTIYRLTSFEGNYSRH
jgi:hypothetical protein